MRRIALILLSSLIFPAAVLAGGFERDLYFGLRNDPDVSRLQEFLKERAIYDGPVTGNFLSRTLEGVKRFQEKEGIRPAAGFFGPKTRARANELFVETKATADSIRSRILALQAQLAELQKQLAAESVSSPPLPSTPVLPAPPVKELRVAGGGTIGLPDVSVSPIKMGSIAIKNTQDSEILFAQIVVRVTDNLNSRFNRGREVFFTLREGTDFSDALVSRTSYKFNSNAPIPDPHKEDLGLFFPKLFKSGAENTYGLWIENLDVAEGGDLKFEFSKFLATTEVSPQGGFIFTLSK